MIRVVVEDLAFVNADAVVRPSTTTLAPLSRPPHRLEEVGGPAFRDALQVRQSLDVGTAVVTPGGALTAELVIHAVIGSDVEPISAGGVRRALVSVLQRAADWELARVAVPPLGTGEGQLSPEDAARIMTEVLAHGLPGAAYPKEIAIVVASDEERRLFEAHVRRMLQ